MLKETILLVFCLLNGELVIKIDERFLSLSLTAGSDFLFDSIFEGDEADCLIGFKLDPVSSCILVIVLDY